MTLVLAARRQIGYGLGRAAGGLSWLLRDDFTTDLPAGSVNGTAAEPGPGTRTVVDAGNRISISGGIAIILPYLAWDSEILRYLDVSPVVAGRLLIIKAKVSDGGEARVSLGNTSNWAHGLLWPFVRSWSPITRMDNQPTSGVWYEYALITRAAGMMFFIKPGNFWKLLWTRTHSAPSMQTVDLVTASTQLRVDYVRVPDALWLPTPIASDGFGSQFGTTNGLGHAEGIAGGLGAGGDGVAWSNAGSTWSVSGGKAKNTAPSGLAQQIAVLNAGTSSVLASSELTRSAAEVGLALSWDSASSPANGVLVYLDGTNCKIDKIVSGSTTNVRTTAVTYSAGAALVVAKNGTEYRVYYNNTLIGTQDTILDAGIVSNTLHGLFSTDAGNTLDNYTCYATGAGGEYATLDQYIQA